MCRQSGWAGRHERARRNGARQPLNDLTSSARLVGATFRHHHDPEAQREQLVAVKREAQQVREENAGLKVTAARAEREARSAEKERDALLRSSTLQSAGDARLTHRLAEGALVSRLREHAKRLAADLAARSAELTELRSGAKHARAVELDVERRAYLGETQRLRQLLDAGATDLQAHKAVWRREYETELRARLADSRKLEERVAEMRTRERVLDEELGRWMHDNDKLRQALAEVTAQAKAGGRGEAEKALAKEGAKERAKAVTAEETQRSANAGLYARIAVLEVEAEKTSGKSRHLAERSGRLAREKREALRELALEQAAGLQARRQVGALEAELAKLGSVAGGEKAASAMKEVLAQHSVAASKVQAAARRKIGGQGAEAAPPASGPEAEPAAGGPGAEAAPGAAAASAGQQAAAATPTQPQGAQVAAAGSPSRSLLSRFGVA
ncbi:hypothetical protein T492DRAFT_836194 [Pavlovales sp. CCMP2436]|nr:hypothetical protein T492DRAFT_836194 [Pavlovales sp. CCMP2436]